MGEMMTAEMTAKVGGPKGPRQNYAAVVRVLGPVMV
jgi:hypothetical protein